MIAYISGLGPLGQGIEKFAMRGRKPKQESRGTEICTRLTEWRRLPKSERQSLRSLACELNTSHQLLGHYLKQWRKKRGPLHPTEFKILKIYAKEGFAGAQELIEKCLSVGLKKRKPFAEIVRETPRRDGEPLRLWVRRIWDRCEDYDTECPTASAEVLP